MKIYQIMITMIVEDKIGDTEIKQICNELDDTIGKNDNLIISNQTFNYLLLNEIIDHPDLPNIDELNDDEKYDEKYRNWKDKSQETINRIQVEMKNP